MSFNSKYTGQQIEDLLDKVDKGSVGGGGVYPVITVTDDFNIEAEPNTFYNIKNSREDSININIDSANYSIEDKEKLTMFTWDNWMGDLQDVSEILLLSIPLGHHIKEDSTYEDYKYSSYQSLNIQLPEEDSGQIIMNETLQIKSYFSNEVKTGNNVNWCIKQALVKIEYFDENGNKLGEEVLDFIGELGQDIIIPITNVQVLTDNNDDLALITLKEEYQAELPLSNLPHVFIEVENDNSEYSHKYGVFGFIPLQMNIQYVYTNEPLPNTKDIYGDGMNLSEYADIKFVKNIPISGCEVANEYVFNIKSPANVTFNQSIKWNNGNEPGLSQNGTYTISLLNGVGCFTFVE